MKKILFKIWNAVAFGLAAFIYGLTTLAIVFVGVLILFKNWIKYILANIYLWSCKHVNKNYYDSLQTKLRKKF